MRQRRHDLFLSLVCPVVCSVAHLGFAQDTDSGPSGVEGGTAGSVGPDVIVGQIRGIVGGTYYAPSVDVTGNGDYVSAYAVGTASCNIGGQSLLWQQSTTHHPVIRGGIYRLKNSRFEQIGTSWVKHGFYATNEVICNSDCQKPPGYTLGQELFPGCSDPYEASLNGSRTYLGPASHVNAHTGQFPYPPSRPPVPVGYEGIAMRLQVHNADLDPLLNPGALYFADSQYIAADDAAAGNGNNNASYHPIEVVVPNPQLSPPTFNLRKVVNTTTTVGEPALHAWFVRDPSVVITNAQVPNEGLFVLGAKVTDLGTGFWHYEYALYNMNSDRAGGSLTLPIALGASVQNVGFHDVDYHSGEPWDGSDWEAIVSNGKITWHTTAFSVDPNANALRWATTYNFRFDTNAPPSNSTATLVLFKPGFPSEIAIETIGPGAGFIDCNDNGFSDPCDIQCGGPGCPIEGCGLSDDCNTNGVPDECEADCNGNDVADSCDLSLGSSEDCNENTVPDECETDCNLNGIPDTCETIGDTDGDGINDCDDECPLTTPPGACSPPELVCCHFSTGFFIADYPRYSCLSLGAMPLCSSVLPGSCYPDLPPPCPTSLCRNGCLIGDSDGDADFDLVDCDALVRCFSGEVGSPAFVAPPSECLMRFDVDGDGAVDWFDFEAFGRELAGPDSGY